MNKNSAHWPKNLSLVLNGLLSFYVKSLQERIRSLRVICHSNFYGSLRSKSCDDTIETKTFLAEFVMKRPLR